MDFTELIEDANNLRIVVFGSRLYGTDDNESDWDLLIIQKKKTISDNINHHYFTVEEYKNSFANGDIVIIETYFAPAEFVLKNEWYEENLIETINKESFRRNISMLVENSYVKAKKKLIVVGDYDLKIGLKSLFHSFRILDYAKQILTHKTIIDYKSMNWLYKELTFLSFDYSRGALWEKIDDKFRGLFNKHRSEFKIMCPIVKEKSKHNQLRQILKDHNVYSDELFEELKKLT